MIIKFKGGYKVVAHSGRNMGIYHNLKQAQERLRQIEFFKRINKITK